MPTKIDIDPFFKFRSQALEQRYKDLSIQSQHQQTTDTIQNPQSIQEPIHQNAVRMSENLHFGEGRDKLSCGSSKAILLGDELKSSRINATFLGQIYGMTSAPDDMADVSTNLCVTPAWQLPWL